jgi:hypothetical protein
MSATPRIFMSLSRSTVGRQTIEQYTVSTCRPKAREEGASERIAGSRGALMRSIV